MAKSKLERTNQGYYYFRKHNGIRYDLNEGVSMGSSQRYMSDIIYIMLESYDELVCQFVDWCSGASDIESNDMIEYLDYLTDKWEEEHPEIVQDILSGKYEEF